MRIAALAVVLALAACNQAGGAFPDLTSGSYRAEATIHGENGENLPVVMIRSGNKVRMELANAEGQMVIVNNAETNENFVLMTQAGRTFALEANPAGYENPMEDWNAEYASSATRTGTCNVAGETGAEWTRDVDGQPHVACVTNDGIILRTSEAGRVGWETTSVSRGAQDASLFTLPEGVQAVDFGSIMGAAAGAAATGGMTPELCNTLRNAGAPPDRLAQAGC